MCKFNAQCWATWFSGFFGIAALLHLVRAIVQVPLVVNNYEVPLRLSLIVFVVFGVLSILLGWLGCREKK